MGVERFWVEKFSEGLLLGAQETDFDAEKTLARNQLLECWAVADVGKSLKLTGMNMTLQLPDDLCMAAQQRAGVESKSLTSWFTDLLRRELRQPASEQPSPPAKWEAGLSPLVIEKLPTADRLVELYDEATADDDLPLSSRSEDVSRPVCFP